MKVILRLHKFYDISVGNKTIITYMCLFLEKTMNNFNRRQWWYNSLNIRRSFIHFKTEIDIYSLHDESKFDKNILNIMMFVYSSHKIICHYFRIYLLYWHFIHWHLIFSKILESFKSVGWLFTPVCSYTKYITEFTK